jgi:hypothetical protein
MFCQGSGYANAARRFILADRCARAGDNAWGCDGRVSQRLRQTPGRVVHGRTLSTSALQKAIDQAASAGGGTVVISTGDFHTGGLGLHSRVTIHLDPGAILRGSPLRADPFHRARSRRLDPYRGPRECRAISGSPHVRTTSRLGVLYTSRKRDPHREF